MSAPSELDWRTLALDGITLVEASAGTGKTYNIALLYLRLLLQQGLGVEQILVTTFTDAAAAELKARIRQRLIDVALHLQAREAGDRLADPMLVQAVAGWAAERGEQALLRQLRVALSEIDRAPIFTIHGCCRRVLSDYPFEAGAPFVAGEIVDRQALLAECVEDFWRRRFLVAQEAAAGSAISGSAKELTALLALVGRMWGLPADRLLLPAPDSFEPPALLRSPEGRKAIEAVLAKGWFKSRPYTLTNLLRALASALEREPEGDPASAVDLPKLRKYLSSELASQVKAECLDAFNREPLITALRSWLDALHDRPRIELAWLAAEARDFVAAELPRRLEQRRQGTFDALIETVHERLHGAAGDALARRLAEAWPALLIDEFQDTDQRQWEIFARIHGAPAEGDAGFRSLLLIGDPKQSIYAFRGADIHTYLQVRDQLPAGRVHSIQRNFRSHPQLLEGLNALYTLAGSAAFADSGIDYRPVRAGEPERWLAEALSGRFSLRLLPGEAATTLAERDRVAIDACAEQIAAQLAQGDVQAGELAVLLDTNYQVQDMRRALNARGVPVVGAGRAAVLDTEWADEIQLLLHALLHPNHTPALRAALATRLLGYSAADLLHLAGEPLAWERQLDRFAGWRLLWEEQGVLAVIEAILTAQAPRLLAGLDGERALTDLRHIGELLQTLAADCFGPAELYARLLQVRRHGTGQAEAGREHQLRIESEASRVQLLTVHAAKGLEFAVVHLPLAWRHRHESHNDAGRQLARFHDAQGVLRLDLGSADFAQHKQQAAAEQQAERMRLLYVALTRAQRQLQLYAFDDLGTGEPGPLVRLLRAAQTTLGSSDWAGFAAALPALCLQRDTLSAPASPAPPSVSEQRRARQPLPDPRPGYGLYSFTSLVRQLPAASGAADAAEDEAEAEASQLLAPLLSAAAPAHPALQGLRAARGPRLGNAVHRLLEQGRGGRPFAEQLERIGQALGEEAVRLEGTEAEVQSAIGGMLDRTLDSELAPGLRLSALSRRAQRAELGFSFALRQARWGELGELLAEHGLGDWWPRGTAARQLNGLMKGYIDLVFAHDGRYHVLDYKTNDLGERVVDYTADALEQAMAAHHYGVQALLYSVALHRYLGRRLDDYRPDWHLGDSWYLFVRALGLDPQAGIWRRRFAPTLIVALDGLLGADGDAA